MKKFEVLCVTMNQSDFSKKEEMHITSDVVFANQCDRTSYKEEQIDGHVVKMISTQTRGVGVNRNIALTYAEAEYCLFADDDVRYYDGLEETVVGEFEKHPNADVFIFHLDSDDKTQSLVPYSKTRKHGRFERMPWGGVRIAIRLSSVRKANIWFTTLFGGGCIFPSGEDSMWLLEAKRKGLNFYVSNKTIGIVSFAKSTWFTGFDKKFYFSKGVYCKAVHRKTAFVWNLYYALRFSKHKEVSFFEKLKWMRLGDKGYNEMKGYDSFV